MRAAVESLTYVPNAMPKHGVQSKVFITKTANQQEILARLYQEGKGYLAPKVRYLLSKEEHTFVFVPAGRLQMRDTSIYPVPAIETWPSWLRESLFGGGVDLDAAYTQYLLEYLTVVKTCAKTFSICHTMLKTKCI